MFHFYRRALSSQTYSGAFRFGAKKSRFFFKISMAPSTKDPSLGKINPVLYLLWKNPFEWGYLPVPLPFLLLLVVDEVVYPKKRRRIREGLCYSHSHLSLTWGWRRTKWRKSLLGTMSLCCVEMNHLLKIGFY